MKVLILVLFFLVGCGSESDSETSSSSLATNQALGTWHVEDGPYCALMLNVREEGFITMYICMAAEDVAYVSYKAILYDTEEFALKGEVIESTCQSDLGVQYGFDHSIDNDKLTISNSRLYISNMVRTPDSNDDSSFTMIYGCFGTDGEFEQTQIYK